jgi:hypothetical protein
VVGGVVGGMVSGGISGGVFSTTIQLPAGSSKPDTIAGMPPGDYYVVAIDDIDAETSRDPDTLEQLSRGASRVTLTEGMPVQTSVRRAKIASLVGDR